jgi:hypothetical protein
VAVTPKCGDGHFEGSGWHRVDVWETIWAGVYMYGPQHVSASVVEAVQCTGNR